MPMFVKDHIWKQTNERVSVRVPLHGVHSKHVDVFTSQEYLKGAPTAKVIVNVCGFFHFIICSFSTRSPLANRKMANYGSFIWEAFLWDKIMLKDSRCCLADGEAVFDLAKNEPGKNWLQLEKNLDKEEKRLVRQEARLQVEDNLKVEADVRSKARQELQREAVRQQMTLDENVRLHIQKVKDTERAQAMLDLENWKQTQKPKPKKAEFKNENMKGPEVKSKKIFSKEQKNLPPPRENGTIQVSFTPRYFPTPLRESKKAEEDDWLSKQLAARRRAGFVAEDLTPEEQDPLWLKDKGDSFYEAGNYLGAISAYSHAINKCGGDQMPELYANRSNAHFAIGNLHKTLQDCSRALELLNPPVEANRICRAKCYGCRGLALSKLGTASRGLVDLEMAVQLAPDDLSLRSALENVQRLADNESSSTDDELT